MNSDSKRYLKNSSFSSDKRNRSFSKLARSRCLQLSCIITLCSLSQNGFSLDSATVGYSQNPILFPVAERKRSTVQVDKGDDPTSGPTVTISPIANGEDGPTSVGITFSEPVRGFDLDDLVLIGPNGQPIPLSETRLDGRDQEFSLLGLDQLNLKTGPHTLILNPKAGDIYDSNLERKLLDGDKSPFAITGESKPPIFVREGIHPFGLEGEFGLYHVEVADVDVDGDFDLVGFKFNDIYVAYNTGNNEVPAFSFDNTTVILELDSSVRYSVFDLVDIDSDGDLDFFARKRHDVDIVLCYNTGSASQPAFICEEDEEIFHTFEGYENEEYYFITSFDFADIDLDGDLDASLGLFSEDYRLYTNIGNELVSEFQVRGNDVVDPYVKYSGFSTLVDIDMDGDLDHVWGDVYSIRVNYNTGTFQSPSFETSFKELYLPNEDQLYKPFFVDVENDGDLDIFGYSRTSGDYVFFQNDAIIPTSALISDISDAEYAPASVEISFNNPVTGFDIDDLAFLNAEGHPILGLTSATLTGSGDTFFLEGLDELALKTGPHILAINPVDSGIIDSNDLPLRYGDTEGFTVYSTQMEPEFFLETINPFGLSSNLANRQLSGFDFGDIDGDGDLDLIQADTTSTTVNEIFILENIGTQLDPYFSQTREVLFTESDLLNIFSYDPIGFIDADLEFVDIDLDGDLDVSLGEVGYGNVGFQYIFMLENVGDAQNHSFNLLNISDQFKDNNQPFNAEITFGDLDGDGDLDLMTPAFSFRNEKIDFENYWVRDYSQNIEFIDFLNLPSRELVDIDFDGDLDFFDSYFVFRAGESAAVNFVRNTGTFDQPIFVRDTVSNPFAEYQFGNLTRISFADIDGDGDLDAFITSWYPYKVSFFRNRTGENYVRHTDDIWMIEGD